MTALVSRQASFRNLPDRQIPMARHSAAAALALMICAGLGAFCFLSRASIPRGLSFANESAAAPSNVTYAIVSY